MSTSSSSSSTTTTWDEVHSLMSQLELLCSANVSPSSSSSHTATSDSDVLRLLSSSRSDLREILSSSETNAKKVILDLSRSVAAEQAAASELNMPLDQLRTQIEALEAAKTRVVLQLQSLQSSKDATTASINGLLSATLHYKEMLQALQQDQSSKVPRTKHFLTLYAIISAIKWDYDSAAAGAVEGYIAPPGGAPVRPFRLDSNLSPMKLADSLWLSIGEAHGL